MDDQQLLRYSRQILLPQVDIEGQSRLLDSRVLIFGMGGLGSPVAMYLAAAGVGHLVLVDDDDVDLTNLQRQIVHTTESVGRPKVESARATLLALNPGVTITVVPRRLENEALLAEVAKADVVVDGTDTFESRATINHACVRAGRPLVSGSAISMTGQVSVFRLDRPDEPCYRCIYPRTDYPTAACREMGVFTPVVGMIGTVQANEALKVLLDLGETLTGRMLLLDAEIMEWQTMQFGRNPNCPDCSAAAREETP